MNFLITGTGGHVGSSIASSLLNADHNVYCFNRVKSYDRIMSECLSIDVIINCGFATPLNSPSCDLVYENVISTSKLLSIIARCCVPKVINFSSIDVYGDKNGLISESYPLSPTSNYGYSKLLCENMFASSGSQFEYYNLRVPGIVLCRPYDKPKNIIERIVLGLSQNKDLTLFGKSNIFNNLVTIDSLLSIITYLSTYRACASGSFNIAPRNTISFADFISTLRDGLNSSSTIYWKNHNEQDSFYIDSRHAIAYNIPIPTIQNEISNIIEKLL